MNACRRLVGPGTSMMPRCSTTDPVARRNRRRKGEGRPTVAFGSPRSGSDEPTSASQHSMNGGKRRITEPGTALRTSSSSRRRSAVRGTLASTGVTGSDGSTTRCTPRVPATSTRRTRASWSRPGSSPARGTALLAVRTTLSTPSSSGSRDAPPVRSTSTTSAPPRSRPAALARSRTDPLTAYPCAASTRQHRAPSCPLAPTTRTVISAPPARAALLLPTVRPDGRG